MCNTYSESGKPCGVQRCEEYVLLQSDRDRLAGVVQGMEDQSKRNMEALRRAEAENAALEQERDELKEELERERVRFAACGVAAMGYEDSSPLEPGSYGYSASCDDVLRFRKQIMKERDALLKVREAADALADALSSKCRSCEEACCHCGFPEEVKAYKEARSGR